MNHASLPGSAPFQQVVIFALILWDVAWRGLALWHAAKRNHLFWFIPILLINNSLGLLAIFYLLYLKYFYRPKAAPAA